VDAMSKAMGLLAQQLGATPVPLEVVHVRLFAPRVTPRDGEKLKELIAGFPGEHPLEVVVMNGLESRSLLAPGARVSLEIRAALAQHFGDWAVL